MKLFRILFLIILVSSFGVLLWYFLDGKDDLSETIVVTNFEECVSVGNVIMESYPRQCRHDDKLFVEDIGNILEKQDLILLEQPRPNDVVSSPLVISGEARGSWFFEATFPVMLTDWDGLIIAERHATTVR